MQPVSVPLTEVAVYPALFHTAHCSMLICIAEWGRFRGDIWRHRKDCTARCHSLASPKFLRLLPNRQLLPRNSGRYSQRCNRMHWILMGNTNKYCYYICILVESAHFFSFPPLLHNCSVIISWPFRLRAPLVQRWKWKWWTGWPNCSSCLSNSCSAKNQIGNLKVEELSR